MGSNSEGRLGVGNRAIRQSSSPCLVEDLIRFKCVQISCGWGHTVAVVGRQVSNQGSSFMCVLDNGEAYSWGVGEHGALGIGSTKSEWSPAKVNLDDKVFIGVSRVSCGSRHTALISGIKIIAARLTCIVSRVWKLVYVRSWRCWPIGHWKT